MFEQSTALDTYMYECEIDNVQNKTHKLNNVLWTLKKGVPSVSSLFCTEINRKDITKKYLWNKPMV